MTTPGRLLVAGALAWCSLARAGSLTPVTVTGSSASLEGASPDALADGDIRTADLKAKLAGSEWLIRLPAPTVISLVAVHHSAQSRGQAAPQTIRITFDDGTSLPLGCSAADGWSRTRVPQVRTSRVRLRVESTADDATGPGGLDEVRVETPAALDTGGPA